MNPATETLVPPKLRDELFALRHELHRHPELASEEQETAERLEAALERAAPGTVRRIAGTGVVGRIKGRNANAPVVAVRGDIDALPVQEATGWEFQSVNAGVMHACGHDVHASWAVGAAHLLAAEPAEGDVVIVLQPAEETGRGAPAVLESGALDDVVMIFGAHVDMQFALGEVVAEEGPVAGSTDQFEIEIVGRGAHAARPHEAEDPIVAAAAIIGALQRIVSRRLAPGEPGVVTVGIIRAGTASNIIPERALLTGTLRAVQTSTRRVLRDQLRATATATAEAHGVRAEVTINHGPPPIINVPEPISWARAAVGHLLGDGSLVRLPAPNLGGEDFAYYLEKMGGCFLRIGARGPDRDPIPAHSAHFLPHDDAVLVGAAVLAETARRASAALARR